MSLAHTVASVLAFLTPSSTDDESPTGADAVRRAKTEYGDIADLTFVATLGEPDIERAGGEIVQEPKVVVPIKDTPFGDAGTLAFDIDSDDFDRLMDVADVALETLEQMEGTEIPIEYFGGNPTVLWDLIFDPETDPRSDEDIKTVNDEDDGDDTDEDTGITVEETTVDPTTGTTPEAARDPDDV